MGVPLPFDPAESVGDILPLLALGIAALVGLVALPGTIRWLRQAGYDRAVAHERVRLEIRPPAGTELTADALTTLVRGLHPRHRRGVDALRIGWPTVELGITVSGRILAWTIEVPRMLIPAVAVSDWISWLVRSVKSMPHWTSCGVTW